MSPVGKKSTSSYFLFKNSLGQQTVPVNSQVYTFPTYLLYPTA